MAEITFDFQRRERIGIAEAVLCQGKTVGQIADAIALAREAGVPHLLTRLSAETFQLLPAAEQDVLDYEPLSRTAILGPWQAPDGPPQVAVVTAGTSDLMVAREATRTLAFAGASAREIVDVGVAGLWRILRHETELKRFPVVIVAAGMEGALFSVVGGLVGGVLIALPTSSGYGAAGSGTTALNSALASCAPGIVTVNIDNGYGAACAALRVLHQLAGQEPR